MMSPVLSHILGLCLLGVGSTMFASAPMDVTKPSPLIRRVVAGPEGYYYTYPHANGYLPDAQTLVLARQSEGWTEFLAFHPGTGESHSVGRLEKVKMYYDISDNGLLATVANNAVVVMDVATGRSEPPRVLWESQAPWRLGDLLGVSKDGKQVYVDFHDYGTPQRHQIRVFETDAVEPSEGEILLEKGWLLNHVHLSPYDQEWIFFSREGSRVMDRMWNWHPEKAPEGRAVFDQLDAEGKAFYVGHELAMHHKLAELTVAFGDSPGGPRGLYEVEAVADGEPQRVRLLSEGARDLHCNISRDGRWAVVDTMGPSDEPGGPKPGWITVEKGSVSDLLIVNLETGARQFLARSHMDRYHPWHLHPHISPDGRWVIYNDGVNKRVHAIEIDRDALEAFLQEGTDSQNREANAAETQKMNDA